MPQIPEQSVAVDGYIHPPHNITKELYIHYLSRATYANYWNDPSWKVHKDTVVNYVRQSGNLRRVPNSFLTFVRLVVDLVDTKFDGICNLLSRRYEQRMLDMLISWYRLYNIEVSTDGGCMQVIGGGRITFPSIAGTKVSAQAPNIGGLSLADNPQSQT
jgi:hypothetical protein